MKIIHENAEATLLRKIESSGTELWPAASLYCAFSKTPVRILSSTVPSILNDRLLGTGSELYLCDDGDLFIAFHGHNFPPTDPIIQALVKQYTAELEIFDHSKLFHCYEGETQREALKALLIKKLGPRYAPTTATSAATGNKALPCFQSHQLEKLRFGVRERKTLALPTVLIVEDQLFSRQILKEMLRRHYTCYEASTAQEAIELYADHAPHVVFLDIELPDMDGHNLATLIKTHDQDSYIVMVTANHYVKDIEAARANKVQGFIAKPYNKQKILTAIENYIKLQKKI